MDSSTQESLSDKGNGKADHIEKTTEHPTAIDTTHTDEAMKVLARYSRDESWEPSDEKRLVRKVDWRLLPLLCLTYRLQYYDKAMLSQAALFGLREDLGLLIGNRKAMSAAIFYLGFIVGAYPTMFLAQRYPIHHVAAGTVTVWGICLILTPLCHNYQSLYAQRFFLGALESGISPMFMMIVVHFMTSRRYGWDMPLSPTVWYSCNGYVSIVSPLVNYGLGHIQGLLSSWKYMYFFAGALTITWGVILDFVLPPDPVSARAFTERERYISVARLRTNNSGVRNTHFKLGQVTELLLDLKFWLVFFTAFLAMIANAPISTFNPIIIINSFGFSTLESLLLVIPSGFYAGTVMLILPYLAYKFANKGGLLFACYIMPTMGAGYAVLMGLQIANIAGYTERSLSSSGLYIGYCLSNFAFESRITRVLVFFYRVLCLRNNRRRDKTGVLEGFEHAYEDDLTDKTNPQFRYMV
ncbi:hypothetical protein BDW75DRAFT_234755 [Aspergillus navahoensis]